MKTVYAKTRRLMELLGHEEIPFGIHYDDVKPDGYGPKPGELFTREREEAGQVDWRNARHTFSCIFGNIWLARKKKKAAWISHEECGCFDLTARKFMKTDELTFSFPLPLYLKMLDIMEKSALTRDTWQGLRKKVLKSTRTWGEDSADR